MREALDRSASKAIEALRALPVPTNLPKTIVIAREVPEEICNARSGEGKITIDYPTSLLADGGKGICFTLAHELVHYHMPMSWRALPAAVEDGLADRIGFSAEPEFRKHRLAEYNQVLASTFRDEAQVEAFLSDLGADRNEYLAFDSDRKLRLLALSYILVGQLGLEDLAALVNRCTEEGVNPIPMSRVMEAARGRPIPIEDFDLAFAYTRLRGRVPGM